MEFWDLLPEQYKLMVLEKEAKATETEQKVVSDTTTTNTIQITTRPQVSHTVQSAISSPPQFESLKKIGQRHASHYKKL